MKGKFLMMPKDVDMGSSFSAFGCGKPMNAGNWNEWLNEYDEFNLQEKDFDEIVDAMMDEWSDNWEDGSFGEEFMYYCENYVDGDLCDFSDEERNIYLRQFCEEMVAARQFIFMDAGYRLINTIVDGFDKHKVWFENEDDEKIFQAADWDYSEFFDDEEVTRWIDFAYEVLEVEPNIDLTQVWDFVCDAIYDYEIDAKNKRIVSHSDSEIEMALKVA